MRQVRRTFLFLFFSYFETGIRSSQAPPACSIFQQMKNQEPSSKAVPKVPGLKKRNHSHSKEWYFMYQNSTHFSSPATASPVVAEIVSYLVISELLGVQGQVLEFLEKFWKWLCFEEPSTSSSTARLILERICGTKRQIYCFCGRGKKLNAPPFLAPIGQQITLLIICIKLNFAQPLLPCPPSLWCFSQKN